MKYQKNVGGLTWYFKTKSAQYHLMMSWTDLDCVCKLFKQYIIYQFMKQPYLQ